LPMLGGDSELRDWDLWGPLVLCLVLAMILGGSAGNAQSGLVFAAVFVVTWLGSAIITLNAKFLGAKLSFFQIVCVMGYCMGPIVVAALLNLLFHKWWWLKLIFAVAAFAWSMSASFRFFKGTVRPQRQGLVVYPLGLFFFLFSWMIVVGI